MLGMGIAIRRMLTNLKNVSRRMIHIFGATGRITDSGTTCLGLPNTRPTRPADASMAFVA